MAENTKTTLDKVREIIAKQLSVKLETVTDESNIAEDLGADSLDMKRSLDLGGSTSDRPKIF